MNVYESTTCLFNNKDFYRFFLLLQSFDDLKRSIIMILAHIYPKIISISELALLLGYSKQSRHFYKTEILKSLEVEKLIIINKPAKNLTQIILNGENELILEFTLLSHYATSVNFA